MNLNVCLWKTSIFLCLVQNTMVNCLIYRTNFVRLRHIHRTKENVCHFLKEICIKTTLEVVCIASYERTVSYFILCSHSVHGKNIDKCTLSYKFEKKQRESSQCQVSIKTFQSETSAPSLFSGIKREFTVRKP